MDQKPPSRLFVVPSLAFAALFLTTPGCGGGETEPLNAQVLRLRFPEQASQVLDHGSAFETAAEGFVQRAPTAGRGPLGQLGVTLPRDAAGFIRIALKDGTIVRVRQVGAFGEAAVAGKAVSYRRAGGTSYWTAMAGGVEEWLHLTPEVVRPGEPLAAWEVSGASIAMRADGAAVEVRDPAGAVRLSVTAPAAYAAGGRPVDVRLATNGSRIELFADVAFEELLVDPMWMTTTAMAQPRAYHRAALLANGKALVASGYVGGYLKNAEVFDPATDTWLPTGELTIGRAGHMLTALSDGRAILTGGYSSGMPIGAAEIYDPATNAWSSGGVMNTARTGHTATLLKDGRVIVTGGNTAAGVSKSAEIFDPATGAWSTVSAMTTIRTSHRAVLLSDGRVLVSGGSLLVGNVVEASAEIYDPETDTWTLTAPMATGRCAHALVLLPNGKVLTAGGADHSGEVAAGTAYKSAEVYDPAQNVWSPAGSMSAERAEYEATLLGEYVLVTGGYDSSHVATAGADVYDPMANSWLPAAAMSVARKLHTAVTLNDGRVLVAGGRAADNTSLASAELYQTDPTGTACSHNSDCQSGLCVNGECVVNPSSSSSGGGGMGGGGMGGGGEGGSNAGGGGQGGANTGGSNAGGDNSGGDNTGGSNVGGDSSGGRDPGDGGDGDGNGSPSDGSSCDCSAPRPTSSKAAWLVVIGSGLVARVRRLRSGAASRHA